MYDKASLALIPSGTKAGTLYSVLPANGDGDFDHTRATSATRVNKDGLIESVASGVPRLDYPLIDGVVQDCPALLLEPSRTNLVTYSEDLTQWSSSSGIQLTSGQLGVGNSNDAWKIQRSSAYNNIFKAISFSTTSTCSIYAKKGNYSFLRIAIASITEQCYFDLENGTIGTTTNLISSNIEYVNNGWYRCSMTFNNASGTGIYIQPVETDGGIGNSGTGHIFIQYPQVEIGSYATSYIPTSGSAVTRNADVCENAGNADLFNDNEGVLFAEFSMLNDSDTSNRYISLSDGSPDNSIIFQISGGGNLNIFNNGTSSENLIDAYLADLTQDIKVAVQYGQNTSDYKVYINGVSQSLNSAFVAETISGLDNLSIDYPIFDFKFNGKVKQLMVFNEALTDAELIELTS